VKRQTFYVEKRKLMVDLNTLITSTSGIHLTDALNINERGKISSHSLASARRTRVLFRGA